MTGKEAIVARDEDKTKKPAEAEEFGEGLSPEEIYEAVKELCKESEENSDIHVECDELFSGDEPVIEHVMQMMTPLPTGGIVRPKPTPHPPKKKEGGKKEDIG